MSKPIIFCDLDGVVVTFHEEAMMKFLKKTEPFTTRKWLESDWIAGDTRKIHEVLNITKEEFWGTIAKDQYFWVHLPKYNWANNLIKTLKHYGDLKFLSSPGPNISTFSDKKEWVDKHFPGVELILCKSKSKYLLSCKDRILIDDLDENITSWSGRSNNYILFPRPWNSAHSKSDICYEHTLIELGRIIQREEIPY